MKHMLQFSLLVIGLIVLCSCSTTPSGQAQSNQANQTDEFETIDAILNDRSKWVDPAFASRQFYRQP